MTDGDSLVSLAARGHHVMVCGSPGTHSSYSLSSVVPPRAPAGEGNLTGQRKETSYRSMSEDAAERRKRLKALKEKAASKSIKFRNYRPQDAGIKQQAFDSKGGGEANSGGAKKGVGAALSVSASKGACWCSDLETWRRPSCVLLDECWCLHHRQDGGSVLLSRRLDPMPCQQNEGSAFHMAGIYPVAFCFRCVPTSERLGIPVFLNGVVVAVHRV